MSPEFVKRYSAPVPRYTSYPTAPHFSADVGPQTYGAWLAALPASARLSLYLHIPFCVSLCWYCGCCTKEVHRYEPVMEYLSPLKAEMRNTAARLPRAHHVTHIHWGGGSPNILSAGDIAALAEAQRAHFAVAEDAEFAVEIDPRDLSGDRVAAFAQAGVTRISIGVQDFDAKVQAAINRRQSYDETERAVLSFREHGIDAINIDLVYGLPHQTRAGIEETLGKVLQLKPSRIASFGYAHLPARLKHQALIDERSLPNVVERFAQSNRIGLVLTRAGYVRIGLDHYALPGDALAAGPIKRNFQGYTTDVADALIGLGASSISRMPQGYAQNSAAAGDYARRVGEFGLATSRGVVLSECDRMRGLVIERLMCDFAFPAEELRQRFGASADPILAEAEALIEADRDRLVERDGGAFRVTPRGRPFVRAIAACFDAYLDARPVNHAPGV